MLLFREHCLLTLRAVECHVVQAVHRPDLLVHGARHPPHERVVEGDDGNVRLVLRTDGPVAKHKSFWLKNPRRFVVDVPGRRNAFDRLAYELNHPLAERLRVGQHPDKVRFVVETSEDVLRKARLTPEDDTLIIDLKRR